MTREKELLKRFIRLNLQMKKAVYSSEITSKFNIGRKQLYALTILHEKGQMNMTTLANEIDVSNQQLTKIVDVLVNKGHIERGYDKNNRRVVLVDLTPEGKDYIENMTKSIFSHLETKGLQLSEKSLDEFEEHMTYLENFVKELLR